MPHVDDGTLHALLDGALRAETPERADAVEAHLAACADCRARLDAAAALRDRAGDVLAALDAGLLPDANDAGTESGAAMPDFQEVLARAAAVEDGPGGPADADAHRTGLRRQYRWTRGLAWAATIVVALGTGYIIRDLAGPTGEIPRAMAPAPAVSPEDVNSEGGAGESTRVEPGRAGPGQAESNRTDPTRTQVRPETGEARDASEPAQEEPAATRVSAKAMEDEAPAEETAATEQEAAASPTPVPPPEFTVMSPPRDSTTAAASRAVRARAEQVRADYLQSLSAPPTAAGAGGSVSSRRLEPSPQMVPTAAPVPLDAEIALGRALVGCYALELGDWSPARGEGEEPYQTPPARFELTDSIGPRAETVPDRGLAGHQEQGRLLLRPLITPDDPMGGSPLAYWTIVPPDSVRLVWSNGFVGVRVQLEVRGDTLTGRAVGGSDAVVQGRPDPIAPARAVRMECGRSGG